jgi:D-arginine dehydrogenase
MIADIDDAFYVKPDAGRMLCSPADETPQDPGDARPDELEIARALDVINEVTRLDARHVRSAWAGLRNFVPDRAPVVGADPAVEGFFWFAAQGGYGIQTAPALARTGAALLRGDPVPADVAGRGLAAGAIAPDRLRNARAATEG